jgi:hypothetical protein
MRRRFPHEGHPDTGRGDEVTRIQAITLESWTDCAWAQRGLQLEALDSLQVLRIRTRNSTYHLAHAGGGPGEILVRGGRYFPDWTRVQLAGASLGRGCLKRHGIYAGFRMEFYSAGRRVVTSPVLSILTDGTPLLGRSA